MDRRSFLTSLLGVVGTTAIAAVLPRQAEVLAAVPPGASLPSDIPSGWRPGRGR